MAVPPFGRLIHSHIHGSVTPRPSHDLNFRLAVAALHSHRHDPALEAGSREGQQTLGHACPSGLVTLSLYSPIPPSVNGRIERRMRTSREMPVTGSLPHGVDRAGGAVLNYR